MSAYATLLAKMAGTKMDQVIVDRIDLAELLAEYDALIGKSANSGTKYTAEFEEAWSLYPSRPGMSKAATFKAWAARLKSGATAQEMIEGTAKYAAFVKAERTEACFIKQPATFYGPGEHYTADWTPTKGRRATISTADQNAINNAGALRTLGNTMPAVFNPDDGMTLEAMP